MIDTTILVQICSAVCEVIATTQQQHPEHLAEKYQSFPWHREAYQLTFREKLAARLRKISRLDVFLREIEQILRNLFAPLFFESSNYQNLMLQVQTLLSSSAQTQESFTPLELPVASLNNQKVNSETAIAILLLDAENLQPDTETEQFLENICTYHLQIKIAFANWKKLGNYDVELHRRGYDMVHVPAGNDMADGKMIAFGSSIHAHYPSAKEILICSSDKVMSNLCNRLRQREFIVYQVRKQDDEIIMVNPATGQVTPYLPKITTGIPSIEECVIQLKELIRTEQKRTSSPWVKLFKISQIFQTKNGFTISRMMMEHNPGKRARDFFIDRPKEFVTHQFAEKEELYITVFELPDGQPD